MKDRKRARERASVAARTGSDMPATLSKEPPKGGITPEEQERQTKVGDTNTEGKGSRSVGWGIGGPTKLPPPACAV